MNLAIIVLLSVIYTAVHSDAAALREQEIGGRIVGGGRTTIDKYPHQISIQWFGSHICGGSIISPNVILTAAHCTEGRTSDYLSVRAGTSFRNRGGVVVNVTKVIQHKEFDPVTFDYDISLLLLETPLPLSKIISVINLFDENEKISIGTNTTITGWGKLQEGGIAPIILQEVQVPILNKDICREVFETITERMLCAGYEEGGRDACQGDSGGPMVADKKLVGIVSSGIGCARPGYPGIYTNVENLRPWIRSNSGI